MASARPRRVWSVALLAWALALSTAQASRALPRATADRPDDAPGPQLHVLYVVPSDVGDRGLDVGGAISASVGSWESWLRSQARGRGLRLDTYRGELDVTFFRLTTSNAMAAAAPQLAIVSELLSAGFDSADKLYAVYYDGASTAACGNGGLVFPSVFLSGSDARDGSSCAGLPFGRSPPAYLDFSLVHEVVHSIGYVRECAPHHTRLGHVDDSPYDLMWGDSGPWADLERMQLDVGRDDYFEARITGCPDLASSRFFEGGGATLSVAVKKERAAEGSIALESNGRNSDGRPAFTCSPTACTGTFDTWPVQTVTLTVTPGRETDELVGWGGACQGRDATCTLTMDASKSAEVTFAPKPPVPLRVAVSGSGRVASTPTGISCPKRCSAAFEFGSFVTLRAAPARGWRFARWSAGLCSGEGVACTFAVSEPESIRASFVRIKVRVHASVVGAGRIVSRPSSLSCPPRCSSDVPFGTPMTLRAVPARGWRFGGWSGSCRGKGACRLSLGGTTSERRVRGRFVRR